MKIDIFNLFQDVSPRSTNRWKAREKGLDIQNHNFREKHERLVMSMRSPWGGRACCPSATIFDAWMLLRKNPERHSPRPAAPVGSDLSWGFIKRRAIPSVALWGLRWAPHLGDRWRATDVHRWWIGMSHHDWCDGTPDSRSDWQGV